MKKSILMIVLLSLVLVISCNEVSSPVSNDEEIVLAGGCSIVGVDIDFVDSCSYRFVVSFLSKIDSIAIVETFLGSNFYIYADSGDYNSWTEYFRDDLTIKHIFKTNQHSALSL